MEALESLHKKFVERKQRLSLNLAIAAEQVVSQGPLSAARSATRVLSESIYCACENNMFQCRMLALLTLVASALHADIPQH